MVNKDVETSLSETIRKPPLVKAKTALRKQKNMAKNDFQYGGWNSYTQQCGTIMTLISPGNCTLQCGVWLCIMTVNSPNGSRPIPCNVTRALGWHVIEFAQTSAILEFYIWFRFRTHHRSRHVILHQSPKFYPRQKKIHHVDFQDGGSQPSWILEVP